MGHSECVGPASWHRDSFPRYDPGGRQIIGAEILAGVAVCRCVSAPAVLAAARGERPGVAFGRLVTRVEAGEGVADGVFVPAFAVRPEHGRVVRARGWSNEAEEADLEEDVVRGVKEVIHNFGGVGVRCRAASPVREEGLESCAGDVELGVGGLLTCVGVLDRKARFLPCDGWPAAIVPVRFDGGASGGARREGEGG